MRDGHGGGNNFPEGALDPRAKQITYHDEFIDECDAVCVVGAHSMQVPRTRFSTIRSRRWLGTTTISTVGGLVKWGSSARSPERMTCRL